MNQSLRDAASHENLPLMDYILRENRKIEEKTSVPRTIFAPCPNSLSVIRASLRAARPNNAPIKFAATLNPVDPDGGYTGLADLSVFTRFLDLLKAGLRANRLDVWPCFVVGKVGTDLHTALFDADMAKQLTSIGAPYGTYIKGYHSDTVENPEDDPLSGMGAANVGREFTEREYHGLLELVQLEEKCLSFAFAD